MTTSRNKLVTTGSAIALSLLVTASLTACFSNPLEQLAQDNAQKTAEELVEGVTGGGIEVELGGELPASFPKDAVPLVDGTIVSVIERDAEGTKQWIVSITAADAGTAAADVRQQLSAAGFEEALWNDSESMVTGMVGNDVYMVTVSIAIEDDETTVGYGVIELE